mgnify:CR=1 FL=1
MKVYNNILETIGNTPLVRINKLTAEVSAQVFAKVETTNPGNSVKDRMAVKMIEDAEKAGLLHPGGTIIEGTSGNTGMGLALTAIIKGYKLICVLNDKQSKEKMDILRAVGAEVVVCPTAVEPTDPRSYYSVSRRLAQEIPNSWYVNQYDNLSNRQAHYESTGPEIWEQTEGKITHFVVGVGTGGTISGVAKYLKEMNPNVQIWGIDTYGSVFKKYHETGVFDENEIYGYITEGIGEDILPKNVDFSLIDRFEKVTDKAGALAARELARKEGLLLGYSCGSAFQGLRQLKHLLNEDSVVVVLFHDHGSRYVGKIYNDDWMRERGFLNDAVRTAGDAVAAHAAQPAIQILAEEPLSNAVGVLKKFGISQAPVRDAVGRVGSIDESALLGALAAGKTLDTLVRDIMLPPLPEVDEFTSLDEVVRLTHSGHSAVLVKLANGSEHVLSRHAVLLAAAQEL